MGASSPQLASGVPIPLIAVVVFLTATSCAPSAGPLAPPTAPPLGPTSTPPLSPTTTSPLPTETPTPDTFAHPLFRGLLVAYTTKDDLWTWSAGDTQQLYHRPGTPSVFSGIYRPSLSPDAKFIAFLDEAIPTDSDVPYRVLWLASTDTGSVRPLVQPEALEPFVEPNTIPLLDAFAWAPNSLEVLFNTKRFLEGPPGVWPNFDLFSADISGTIDRPAIAGDGGSFTPSPDGSSVAVATTSTIAVIDLLTSERRTLLQFDPFLMPCECYRIPHVTWTPDSRSILVSIPPADLLFPDAYKGQPEQAWLLPLDGAPRVIFEAAPLGDQLSMVSFSPDASRLAYLQTSEECRGRGALHVLDLSASTDSGPLHCITQLPEWTPDGSHYIFSRGEGWELGNVHDSSTEDLPFLDIPPDPGFHSRPELTWIDSTYFLLTLRTRATCSLSVATLQGVTAPIVQTSHDECPNATYGFLAGE